MGGEKFWVLGSLFLVSGGREKRLAVDLGGRS
jgi:predicted oxidoreductase